MDDTIKLIRIAQTGDEDAKRMLIEQNTGLIWSIVKRFLNRGYEAEDIFQVGAIGLLKCIDKFDESFNVKFSTYAVPMIMGEIKRFLRDDGMIKVSRHLKEIAIKAKYIEDSIIKKTGESPNLNEVAKQLNINVEELILALDANRDVESLYSTVYQNDGKSVYLIDKLDKGDNKNDEIVDSIVLKEIINTLSERDKQIITLRYFCDKTQSEVAKKIGVSQVQVSRIEKKILKSMREKFS